MAVHGVNFRATSTYVTDGADDTYCLAEGSTTRGGLTFAWDSPSFTDKRDRSTSIDVRLAGSNFNTTSAKRTFQVTGGFSAGTYDITIASGDAVYSTSCALEIQDNTTSLFTVSGGSISGGHFRDALGNDRTSAAWPGSNSPKTGQVFSSTTFTLITGNGVASNWPITHVHWTAAGGGGGASAALGSTGAAIATFNTSSTNQAALSAAGAATATFNAAAVFPVAISAAGAATATFNTSSKAAADLASAGAATANFNGAALGTAALASAGQATATFTATANAAGSVELSSAGAATATFNTTSLAQAALSIAGQSSAIFQTPTIVAADLGAIGASTVTFTVPTTASAALSISGRATATFVGAGGTASTAIYGGRVLGRVRRKRIEEADAETVRRIIAAIQQMEAGP